MNLKLLVLLFLPVLAVSQTSPAGVLTSAACKLWLDAGDLNADGIYTNNPSVGTSVTTWNDKSTNANNLTQATATAEPTYSTIGGFSCVKFDNTGTNANYMNVATQAMLTPGTMYFVLYMTNAGNGANCLFDRNSSGNTSIRFNQWNGTNQLGFTKYATADYNSTLASTYSANVIVSYLKTSASNNLDIAQNSSSLTLTVGSANPGLPLYVLGKNSNADGMNGFVMEILAYNVDLNIAQKYIVDNYLSAKYGGIAIITDKYAGDTPANGNYDFEMGGVGTEATGSNLSAASSITGGLEAVQSVAMDNGEYLMYGHPAGTNSLNFSDVGGMSAGLNKARWDRIWYFNWTHVGGTNETVNLTFDFSDGGSAGGSAVLPLTNYKLLYRAGLSGNWTEVMNASSITGDRVTFNSLAWNTEGNGYYTIGTLNNAVSPLPIELIDFKAEACDNKICLDWATASEKNTNFFLIEKSKDAQTWVEVTKVAAAGNSSSRIDYSAIDENPAEGMFYYRLTTVDLDGTTSHASLQAVSLSKEENSIHVFPNPSSSIFTITSTYYEVSELKYFLYNSNGEYVKDLNTKNADGGMSIDLSDFPKGIYFLNVRSDNGFILNEKLILK
jgi:hypothetical protein